MRYYEGDGVFVLMLYNSCSLPAVGVTVQQS